MATEPNLGPVIRYHRKCAGLTQAELARISEVGKTVVFDIEKGKRSVRFDTLMKVLRALNIRLDWESPLRGAFEALAENQDDSDENR